MLKAIAYTLSRRSILLSLYLFAFLFFALYGRQGFQTFNQLILWGLGPLMAFYILEPNMGKLDRIPKEYFLYISLLLFAFLGYVNVINDERFFRYVQVIAANFVLMIIVYFAISNIKEWLLVWRTLWIVGLAVAATSLVFEPSSIVVDEYYRLEGLAGNANGTANYARVAIIAALISLQFYNTRIWQIITWTSILFLSYTIILTASRGNFGNLVFIVGGYFVLKYFSGWRLILLFILLLGFGNLILFSAENFLSDFYLYQRLTRNDTVADAIEGEGRLQLYSTAWDYFLEYPFLGVGLNQFRFYSGGHISHTDILDVLVQLGIFAGIFYVSIYVRLYKRIRRLDKWIVTLRDKRLYQLVLLCFCSEVFLGLSNPNWFTQLQMIVLSLMIVYVTKIRNTNTVVIKEL